MENLPIIIYNTADGKANVTLFARDGSVWMNQNQLAELFDTSKQNIGQHISNILEEKELDGNSVVKNYFTTAADGKQYEVVFYALEMILAIGFRVRSKRGIQFQAAPKASRQGKVMLCSNAPTQSGSQNILYQKHEHILFFNYPIHTFAYASAWHPKYRPNKIAIDF